MGGRAVRGKEADLEGTVGGGLEALTEKINQLALLMSLHPSTQHCTAHSQLHLRKLHLLHPHPLISHPPSQSGSLHAHCHL